MKIIFIVLYGFVTLALTMPVYSSTNEMDFENLILGRMNLGKFYGYCGVPGICGNPMRCEGRTVELEGWIDYDNIFDKPRYPRLPYEKFVLVDTNGNRVEVWTVADDNRSIFEKIWRHKNSGATVVIKGIVKGHDLPMMTRCERWVFIELDDADAISFFYYK